MPVSQSFDCTQKEEISDFLVKHHDMQSRIASELSLCICKKMKSWDSVNGSCHKYEVRLHTKPFKRRESAYGACNLFYIEKAYTILLVTSNYTETADVVYFGD